MSPDFAEILKRSIAGSQPHRSLLYDRFCRMVMGICLRYGADRDQAEDMFQEAFYKIFHRLRQVRTAEALPGWIRSLTVNSCIDFLKLDKNAWIAPLDNMEVEDQHYVNMLDGLTEDVIVKLINDLPEGYRAVLNMFVVDGYNHKEISARLGIAESTSRSQLTYARRLLQEKMRKLNIGRYESVV